MKIQICLDSQTFTQKPQPHQAGAISNRLGNSKMEITFDEFVKALGQGRTYSPSTYKGTRRKASDFEQTYILCADIDHQNYSYEDIKSKSHFQGLIPSIIHESFSSKPECRKWRVIYILENAITCPATSKRMLRCIKDNLDGDPAIVDNARMLYGTSSDRIHYSVLNLVPSTVIESIVGEMGIDNSPEKVMNVKKLPEKVGVRAARRQQKHRNKAETFFYNRSNSRRQRIFHTVRSLYFTGDFTLEQIEGTLQCFLSDNQDEFTNYDKDVNRIINESLEWCESLVES